MDSFNIRVLPALVAVAFIGLPALGQARFATVELSSNAALASASVGDVRAFQHGIDFVQLPEGKQVLIWASSGVVPRGEDASGEWVHDVYYSWIDPARPKISPTLLISAPAAQEPASAAATPDGNIMITMEDAWNAGNNLAQSFAVFDRKMRPVLPYQNMVFDGGHSGHVAATNTRFVVFYSEEWVPGGGVDDLGSGDDVWLASYDVAGRILARVPVAVGEQSRDWWPLIAGGEDRVLLLWQRFVPGKQYARLMYRVFDPVRNVWLSAQRQLPEGVLYYTYDVQYLPGVMAFMIVATSKSGSGVAWLVGPGGEIMARRDGLPGFVREAQPAIRNMGGGLVRVVYPAIPDGLSVFEVSNSSIRHAGNISIGYNWRGAGSDGIFTSDTGLFFVNLSPAGLVSAVVELGRLAQE